MTVLLTFALMPVVVISALLSLPDSVVGPDSWLSAWFWVPVAVVSAGAVVQQPPSRRTVRNASPFLVFLLLAGLSLLWTEEINAGLTAMGRLLTFGLVYFAGTTATRDRDLLRTVKMMSLAWIALITVGFGLALLATDASTAREFDRLMGATALNIVVLFIVASIDRPTRVTAAIGLVAIAVTIAANARMASFVLLLLLILAPSWVVPRFVRPVAATVAVIVAAILLSVSVFGFSWWFGSGRSAVWGVDSISDELDLSSRAQLWPAVLERCEGAWFLGSGVGSSSVFASEARATAREPHNEYLRVTCENGFVGSAFLATFLVMVGFRAVRSISRSGIPVAAATASLQLVLAMLLLGITDVPSVAVIQFLAPAAIVWAWSDRLHSSLSVPAPRSPSSQG